MATSPTTRLLGAADRAAWLSLWERSDRWLSLHPDFSAACAGEAAAPLGIFEGNELVAVAPFARDRARGLLPVWRHVSPASFGGFLAEAAALDDESRRRELLGALGRLPQRLWRSTLILQPGLTDARGAVWAGWSAGVHYNYISDWTDPEAFLRGCGDSVQRQARKARRNGLAVAAADSLEDLMALRGRTTARQGFHDPVSEAQYAALLRAFAPGRADGLRAVALLVRDGEGRALAGGLFAADARRTYYLMGASDPQSLSTGAPTLLHIGASELLTGMGWPRRYDWVGANTPGVAQFKRGFGPELEMLVALRKGAG
jgi:hypothetical protein